MNRDTSILIAGLVLSTGLLLTSDRPFVVGLVVSLTAFLLLWLISLAVENASIVDTFWGPGFVLVGVAYLVAADAGPGPRAWLVMVCTSLWAVRLALHIGTRNAGSGEDFRYRRWREQAGRSFWWVSLFKVFLLQAVILWIVSSPLLLSHANGTGPGTRVTDILGIGLFVFGFAYETIADRQLARFKKNPDNRGRILRSGLWSRSRHPNYFGEALLWWGLGLVAMATGGWLAAVGPALLTFLLVRISGAAMLDAALVDRRPGYADYVAETPALIPRLTAPERA